MRAGTTVSPSTVWKAIGTSPRPTTWSRATIATPAATVSSPARAYGSSSRPAAVSTIPRPCRSTSGVPMSSARVLSARLTVGCGIRRIEAATVTCSVSATVTKTGSRRRTRCSVDHFHALIV